MKRSLLLAGVSAMTLAAFADTATEPREIENALMYAISSNGVYGVSQSYSGMSIIELTTGKVLYSGENGYYDAGLGKCVSDNGVVLGGPESGGAEYWKDGEWNMLELPDYATSTNLANAITPDGNRICGSIGVGAVSWDEDVLMQAPCIWNFDGEGYGLPVMLPRPERDITGSIPQYITAVDMSADGKTIVGQVINSTGFFNYPIIYREAEDGTWSYELPHIDLFVKEGETFPENPGNGPAHPNYEDYMTPAEVDAYNDALNAYYDSGYNPEIYPEFTDYMTDEAKADYLDAMAEYEKENLIWSEKFNAFYSKIEEIQERAPNFQFNSIKISPDGKTYGCTIVIEGERDPMSWGPAPTDQNVWVFDVDSDKIVKYEQSGDLNLFGMANEGIAIAITAKMMIGNSYVLKDGEVIDIHAWIGDRKPEYAAWMNDNMRYLIEEYVFDEDGNVVDVIETEAVLTGRAATTPDLSVIVLSVDDYEFYTDGFAYVFDMKVGTGVEAPAAAATEQTIYDLSGRRLKEVAAPGIYIINGEKKAVR